MRIVRTAFSALVLVVSASSFAHTAFGHGGSYRGPFGDAPDGSRDPSDPPAPPPEGGPSTPSGDNPGGPETPGGSGDGPTTPGGGDAPGGGTPSGGPPTAGGGAGGSGPSTDTGRPAGAKKSPLADWPFWWGCNKDEFLNVKSAVRAGQRSPFSTHGRRNTGPAVLSMTDEAIQRKVVPALRELLADPKQSFHIRSAAELALAKIGDTSIVASLKTLTRAESKDVHREVRESAALALGLLQQDDDATRAFLVETVRDTSLEGSHARPFAAISLGLLGDRARPDARTTAALLEQVARPGDGPDVRPACLTALGLLGDESAIPELLVLLRTGRTPGGEELKDIERSYVAAALGKIAKPGTKAAGETAVLDAMLRLLESDRAKCGMNLRRSITIALGEIGPQCGAKLQHRVADVLLELAKSASDEQERSFATMALGRLGAHAAADAGVRKDVVRALSRAVTKGKDLSPSYAALALGLVGRGIADETGVAPEEEIRAPLRKQFIEESSPRVRAAFAIALGLVRDPLAVESLTGVLKDPGCDKRLRASSALALGMIGASDAREAIRTTLHTDSDRELRVHCAMAAGLLGDVEAVGALVATLSEPDVSNYEIGSAAAALGQIGDEHAADALLAIALDKDGRYPELSRSLAVVALGQIGDRRSMPVLSRVAIDVNYRAHVPAITELLTIL